MTLTRDTKDEIEVLARLHWMVTFGVQGQVRAFHICVMDALRGYNVA